MRGFIFTLSATLFSFAPLGLSSQNTKVVIKNSQDASVDQIFELIKKQTSYRFVYRSDMFDNIPKIYLEKGTLTVEDLLEKIANGNFYYEITSNNTIIIKKNSAKSAQTIEVKGKVTDANGAPVSNIYVYVTSTEPAGSSVNKDFVMRGTTTDSDGNFSIQGEVGHYLMVMEEGFSTYSEIISKDKTVYNVKLKSKVKMVEEVVMIGYGSSKKKDLTGSVASINAEDIQQIKTQSIDNALVGKLPGVNVQSRGGAPGSGAIVNIRGLSQIRGDNQPLYVIDGIAINITPNSESLGLVNYGFRENPLLAINPDDIERIDVLKDASSAAIYGSRAANGVIIITTKRGRRRQAPKLSFNVSSTIQSPSARYDYLNAADYKRFAIMAAQTYLNNYDPSSWPDFPREYAMVTSPDTYFGKADTDWQKKISNNAALWSQYSMNVSGGSENVNYMISAGVSDQDGVMKENDFKRYTFASNLDATITKWLKIGGTINYNYSVNKNKGFSSLSQGNFRPDLAPFDDKGNFATYEGDFGTQYTLLGEGMQTRRKAISKNLLGSIYGEASLLKDLKFKSQLSVSTNTDTSTRFITSKSQEALISDLYDGKPGAQLVNQTNESWSTSFENTLSYNKQIGNNHRIDAIVGISYNHNRYDASSQSYRGFPDDDVLVDINSATYFDAAGSESLEQGLNSIFGRINYGYKGKYLLTFTGRRDGSTKFGPGSKYGFFPSGALAWNVHKEHFMEKVSFLNQLKFRASWGITGSDNLPSFTYLAYYKSLDNNGSKYDGVNGIVVSGVPNDNIRWEQTAQTDFGMDFSLFNSRVNGEIVHYNKKTTGIILMTPLGYETGFKNWNANVGDVSNKGWEFLLGVDVIRNKNLKWNTSFNLSTVKNNLDHLYGGRSAGQTLIEGQPLGVFIGYDVVRIAQNQAEIDALNSAAAGGQYQSSLKKPGDYIFRDINGDGKITSADRVPLGDINPKYFGGWNNTVTYKNWDFSMNWNFSQGGKRLYDNITNLYAINPHNNPTKEVFETWTPDNPNAPYAAYGSATHGYTPTSRSVANASYIKLRSASIGYTLPSEMFKDTGISRVHLSLSGNNLLTITNYPGLDPEDVISSSFANRSTGYTSDDGRGYPNVRTFTFSLNVTF
ncbi:hypothetical protein BBH99_12945 [Chryseobacterium contaminans]|nr:TonB-dependent receptor [Chryseobacterium contaminans]OCA72764.1 hypothetical protein BBH99_12945 [Chryseobacterium contaminans]